MQNKEKHNLLSTKQVSAQTGLSSTSLWRKAKKGIFPSPVYLGCKKFWYQHQIDNWLTDNLASKPSHNNLNLHT